MHTGREGKEVDMAAGMSDRDLEFPPSSSDTYLAVTAEA